MPSVLCARVVVPAIDGAFSYRVKPADRHRVQPGMRVLVPFANRRLTGFVIEVELADDPLATKPIESVLDSLPVFSAELLEFTRWISDYYLCPWGDVLKAALPAGISLDEKRYYTYVGAPEALESLSALQFSDADRALLAALNTEPLTAEQLRRRFGLTSASPELKRLRAAGVIDLRPLLRPPLVRTKYDQVLTLSDPARAAYATSLFASLRSVHQQQLLREIHDYEPDGITRAELLRGESATRRAALKRLLELGHLHVRQEEHVRWDPRNEHVPHTADPTQLTPAQLGAVSAISEAVEAGSPRQFLLFGVTGSGKTQVYIEAIRRALALGRTALVLLPEIALTPFLWSRFYRAFGDRVAIQHSAQSPAVRYDLWRQIAAGRYPVVVGARSAVFAPLAGIGLIVIDEEHEASFKQMEPPPLYHARDCALMRARLAQAAVVLGSATPSMESWYHAQAGRYRLLELPERVGGAVHPLTRAIPYQPAVAADDSYEQYKERRFKRQQPAPEAPILSEELRTRIALTVAAHKQVMLLQNRRGHSPFLICKSCGDIPMCPHCSVSLTFHRKGQVLRCHYCDQREAVPARCAKCGSDQLSRYGIGTQRLEDELATLFPAARILRMDSDTASGAGKHAKMVSAFAAHEYDILVGTQMIAKGLDFAGVDLAAVVRADAELFFPDFRSTERAASLILQLAGRAGRRDVRGEVLVQTAVPDHPVIQTALRQNWREFAEAELATRDRSNFPPYSRLILIRAVAREESPCARALLKLRTLLKKADPFVDILGPAPAIVLKIEDRYRYTMLARVRREADSAGQRLRQAVRRAVDSFRKEKAEPGVKLEIDVDPQSIN
ncbi:primosomal protein N' [candidate division KSB1 bacterium]|nr:primosomal protein N' [candidate division KSB1 bacterium]